MPFNYPASGSGVGGGVSEGTNFPISRSLRFVVANSGRLTRTPSATGNPQKWTFVVWLKRGQLSNGTVRSLASAMDGSSNWDSIAFDANDKLHVAFLPGSSGFYYTSARAFRDPHAHFMLQVAFDSTLAGNKLRAWVNNEEIAWGASGPVSLNFNSRYNTNGQPMAIGATVLYVAPSGQTFYDGYMSEMRWIDGVGHMDPTIFGEINPATGVWGPKAPTGLVYGTNGGYWNFSDNSSTAATALGKDSAGTNNLTPAGFSVTAGPSNDSLVDTPSNNGSDTGLGGEVRGNYPVISPLTQTPSLVIIEGNLKWAVSTTAFSGAYCSLKLPGNVKSYFEVIVITAPPNTANYHAFGLSDTSVVPAANPFNKFSLDWDSNGYVSHENGGGGVATGIGTPTTGDVLQVARDGTKLWLGRNDVWMGGLTPGAGAAPFNAIGVDDLFIGAAGYGISAMTQFHFGARPWQRTCPAGFKAVCTQNIPAGAIAKASSYFETLLWTGNSTPARVVSGLSFQPDLIWIKERTLGYQHTMHDSVRGFTTSKKISSGSNSPQGDPTLMPDWAGYVSGVSATGFTLDKAGTGATDYAHTNRTGSNYAGWSWKKGKTPGVDIVTYSGNGAVRSIAHALGVTPKLIIIKRLDAVAVWCVGGFDMGWNGHLYLNTTDQFTGSAAIFNNTAPTSTVFTINIDVAVNGNGGAYVAYLFAEVPGFSRISRYTGNASANGTFIWCGFKPRWIMVKRTGNTSDWHMYDTARGPQNPNSAVVAANVQDAESLTFGGVDRSIDVLANGFKFRTPYEMNGAADNYVFAAFAETPFKYARAR